MTQTKLLAVGIVLLGTISNAAAWAAQPLAAADNAFGFKLFKELAKTQPAANICISPYSTATVLHMVGNGAAGKTKIEMQQVLGTTGLSFGDINDANRDIAQSLKGGDNSHGILTIANSIWYREGAQVNAAFIAANHQFYDATVEALNFGDPRAVDAINGWVRDKTKGKIQRLADGMIDRVNTQMFLANAIYFKGKWSSPFAAKYTKNRAFHLRGGGEKMIPMMLTSEHLDYREGGGYQAVRLPYEGNNLSMYIFLPEVHTTPETILGKLGGDGWQRVTKSGFSSQHVNFVLPKFKVEYSVELGQPLQALGMRAAFSASSADFSSIAPGLFISAARHKTFVEINEEGTEAAAVTGLGGTLSAPREIFDMIVDRPFLLFIEDAPTQTILFMGVVFDPMAS
jgi:serine protease inhibitor